MLLSINHDHDYTDLRLLSTVTDADEENRAMDTVIDDNINATLLHDLDFGILRYENDDSEVFCKVE